MKSKTFQLSAKAIFISSLVLLGLVYFVLLFVKPANVFYSLDEGGKLIYLQNVLRTGDPSAPLDYPGIWLDANLEFIPLHFYGLRDGSIFSWWPVGFPLLTLPFYAILGWYGLYIIPYLAGIACAALSGFFVLRLLPDKTGLAWLAFWVTGVGTPVLFYSLEFWEHTAASACVAAAIALAMTSWNGGRMRGMFLAGVLCSMAVFLRTETLAFAAGIGLIILLRRLKLGVIFLAAFICSASIWLGLNLLWMQDVVSPQWSSMIQPDPFAMIEKTTWRAVPYLFFNSSRILAFPFSDSMLVMGLILSLGLFAVPRLGRFPGFLGFWFSAVLAVCGWVLFAAMGYNTVHGFLLAVPFVGLAGLFFTRQERGEGRFLQECLMASVAIFLAAFFLRGWEGAGGLQWGPRYLLPFYPLLVSAACIGLGRIWPEWSGRARLGMGLLSAAAVLVGAGFQIRGQITENIMLNAYDAARLTLETKKDRIRITDCDWIAMTIPDAYWSGNIFFVRDDAQMEVWLASARARDVDSAWRVDLVSCPILPVEELSRSMQSHPAGLLEEKISIPEE